MSVAYLCLALQCFFNYTVCLCVLSHTLFMALCKYTESEWKPESNSLYAKHALPIKWILIQRKAAVVSLDLHQLQWIAMGTQSHGKNISIVS